MPDSTEPIIALHPAFVDWVIAAVERGLTCPVGRALYVCNRKRHTWPRIIVKDAARPYGTRAKNPTPVELMVRMRHGTAQRWERHWREGGSLHSLSHASDAISIRTAQARGRRYRDSFLDETALLRRWIRRARRKVTTYDVVEIAT